MFATQLVSENLMMDAALEYGQRGWPVIPLWWPLENGKCACGKPGCTSAGKHPRILNWTSLGTTDPDQIIKWWTKWPHANIGLLTGPASGILLLDVDTKDDGPGALAGLERVNGKLPETLEAITGSLGRHYLFKYPGTRKIPNTARFHEGLDTRSTGGMFVAAPSLHGSGRRYEWANEAELAEAPEWLLSLMAGSNNTQEPREDLPQGGINEGSRNNTLTSMAGAMRRRGMSFEAIVAALTEENKKCSPPLSQLELRTIAASISKYDPEPSNFRYTDLGNAERLIGHHGADIRYCHPWSKWLVWDGQRWSIDADGAINRLASDMVRQMLVDAAAITDTQQRKELLSWQSKSESNKARREMLDTAKSMIPISPEDMDTNQWLLNVENGEIDLRTGKLVEHRRENLITKLAAVTYDPDAKCPTWESFLDRIMDGDTEIIKFLQRAIGYSLTGATSEQCLFILHGSGANGKSTFLDAISALFGKDYHQNTPATTLMVKRNEGIPNDVAALKGARLVTAIEAEEGQRLAESLIKSLTGGDLITARFMRSEFFTFKPEFKLFLATNHKPQIRGLDPAIWRRINLIPFQVTIPPEDRDGKLPEKLLKELPGILNWAIAGCMEWQNSGLQVPTKVKFATEGYRSEMDTFGDFLADRCSTADPKAKVENKDMRSAYESWCSENGVHPINHNAFHARLVERGFSSSRGGANGRAVWHGIKVINNLFN